MSERPTHINDGGLDILFYSSDIIDQFSHKEFFDIKLSDQYPVTVKTKQINVTHKTTKEICYRELNNPLKMAALESDMEVHLSKCFKIHENFEKTVSCFFNKTNDILNICMFHR